jgi:hypothetical protein
MLVAQLAAGEGKGQKVAPASAIARMRAEHQRMQALLQEADLLRAGLQAAEELALLAHFGREDPAPFVAEASELHGRLRKEGPYLLLALEPRHDEITFLLQEADAGRGLDVWLLPMVEEAKARRWTLTARPGLGFEKLKRKRRWNDLVGAAGLAAMLEGEREFREVLLHVRGLHAGTLLALEGGMHRFFGVHPEVDPAHLIVEPLAMRAELSEEEVHSDALQPHPMAFAKQLALMDAVRVRGAGSEVQVVVTDRQLRLSRAGYWREFEEVALEHLLHWEQKGGFDREATCSLALERMSPRA